VGVVVVGGASVGGWGAVLGQRVFIALQPGARDLQARQPGRINLSTQLSCCRPEGNCQGVELGTLELWPSGRTAGDTRLLYEDQVTPGMDRFRGERGSVTLGPRSPMDAVS